MSDIKQLAKGRWREILVSLGIPEKSLGINKICPVCPETTDAFSFNGGDDGLWFCRREGAGGDGFRLLENFHSWTFKQAAREVESVLGSVPTPKPFKPTRDPSEHLNRVWSQTRPVALYGPVHRYLLNRGVSVLPNLREALQLKTQGKTYAAMVGLVVNVKGAAQSLHVSYLDGDKKADLEISKRLLPPKGAPGSLKGCAVRLFETGSDTLHVGEGLETMAAVRQLTQSGDVFAACNAVLLEHVEIPAQYRRVEIWTDFDVSGAGEAASAILKRRLYREGIRAVIHYPPAEGLDWLDCLNERKVAA